MKVTDEVRKRILGTYWDSPIRFNNDAERVYRYCGYIMHMGGQMAANLAPDGWKLGGSYNIALCQLILKPLSKISDEDNQHCLRIINKDARLRGVVNFTYVGRLECHGVSPQQWSEIIDFLRLKGYDCGYGAFESLIDAGIAISAPNDERSVATDAK